MQSAAMMLIEALTKNGPANAVNWEGLLALLWQNFLGGEF
jgi:hypothetical protein